MLRIGNLKNVYQKRLIRPLYAQTQATPYAAVLDDTLRDPVTKDFTFTAGSFKYKNGLVPGTVMANRGDKVTVATGANAALRPFGLLANFVGGDLNDIGDENYVGVWRGPDAVFEILAPGFDDTGLSAAWDASTQGLPVPLYAGVDGRLTQASPGANALVVAHLMERPNSNRIIVDLRV